MYAGRGKWNHRRTWQMLLIGSGLFMTIALFCFVGLAVYLWLPAGLIDNLNPLGDSHASVLNRLNNIGTEMVGIYESVQDEPSRQSAIDKLKSLSLETLDLKRRAARLGEIDDQEYDRLVAQFNKDAALSKERTRTAIANLLARNLRSKELADTAMELAFSIEDVAMTTRIAWKALPIPNSKAEQLAHHKVEIERDIWREFAAVTSLDQYNNLAYRLASFPNRYNRLRDLQIEVSKQSPGIENSVLKYNGISLQVGFQSADLNNKLQARYGTNTAVQAVQDEIEAAKSDLVRVAIESSSRSHAGGATSNGPPQFGVPGFPPGVARTAEEAFAQSLSEFKQRYGSERTVILHIKSELDLNPKFTELLDKVMTGSPPDRGPNPKNGFADKRGNIYTIVFTYNGPVDEILPTIDFGRILSVDRQNREITVDYNK